MIRCVCKQQQQQHDQSQKCLVHLGRTSQSFPQPCSQPCWTAPPGLHQTQHIQSLSSSLASLTDHSHWPTIPPTVCARAHRSCLLFTAPSTQFPGCQGQGRDDLSLQLLWLPPNIQTVGNLNNHGIFLTCLHASSSQSTIN